MEECFRLLECAISAEAKEEKTKRGAYDPLKELADRLEASLLAAGFPQAAVAPPAGRTPTGDADCECDSRVRYAHMIVELLNRLCLKIEKARTTSTDMDTLLPVKRIKLISDVLEFLIPTSVSPYLDEGIGTPVEKRSSLVKFWKRIDEDEPFRIHQLLRVAKIIFRLTKLADALTKLVANKFLGDVVSTNEQLLHFGETILKRKYEWFILEKVRRSDLMRELFLSMAPIGSSGNSRRPTWFTLAVGRRLSELVMQSNGVYNLATALSQDDPVKFDNFKFVERLAGVISTRPQFLRDGETQKTLYHANILKQFVQVMQKHPQASHFATWFAMTVEATARSVPRTVAVCVFDTLLHPWETLCDRTSRKQLVESGWSKRFDASLKTLALYATGLPPTVNLHCLERLKKLFPLWLSLYGSSLTALETVENGDRRQRCRLFVDDLNRILSRVLTDRSFSSDRLVAEFLESQLTTENCFAYGDLLVEFTAMPVVAVVSDAKVDSDEYEEKYSFIRIWGDNILASDAQCEARSLDRVVNGIVDILLKLDKERKRSVVLSLLSCSVDRWRTGECGESTDTGDQRFVSFGDAPTNSSFAGDFGMRLQYLAGHLGPVIAELDLQSADTLASVVEFAQSILESTNSKLKKLVKRGKMDVVRTLEGRDRDLAETEAKTVDMAIALVGGVLATASDSKEIKTALQSAGSTLAEFCTLVDCVGERECEGLASARASAAQIAELLRSVGLSCEPRSDLCGDIGSLRSDATVGAQHGDDVQSIYRDLDDPLEAIQGHALIALARLVRKRDSQALAEIDRNPDIMRTLFKAMLHSDSYVYLSAIRAMAELAFWKRTHFDVLVDFFVDPKSKLSALVDNFQDVVVEESDKVTFLLVQRVKVGEALGKVCKALGDMAPWHFDRLVGPLLALVRSCDDAHLKASCVCALADLVVACRGRGFSHVINEMFLLMEQLMVSSEEAILRRASMVLLRAVIVSFDTAILQGLSSQLRDLHRHLRRILLVDSDDSVRLHAELCLIDIKEQMNKSVDEMQRSMCKKIRIA